MVAWGHNLFGRATVPPGLRNVVAISAGAYSVKVTNLRGGTVSAAPAMLRVVALPPAAVPSFIPGSPICRGDGAFECLLKATPGSHLKILVSTNLVDWAPLMSLSVTNSQVPFTDPGANSARRFYRAIQSP